MLLHHKLSFSLFIDFVGEELLHEMLSADDGLADLAEADQIHSEDQEPNNILHTDSGAESRREAQVNINM